MNRKKISFIRLINISGIILLAAIACITIGMNTINSYKHFNLMADQMRKDFVERQKQIIKREVEHVVEFIYFEITHLYESEKWTGEQIQSLLVERINSIRFGKNGYIFVADWNGTSIAHGAQPDLIGANMWDYEDSRGTKTSQGLIRASKIKEGGYLEYWWRKPDTGVERPKIGYAKAVPEWEWSVCTGVYIDDIEEEIDTLYGELKTRTRKEVFISAVISIITLILYLVLFNSLSNRLKTNMRLFISFFTHAANSDKPIQRKAVQFMEFDKMAEYANKMLEDKIRAQQELLNEKEQLQVTIRSIGDGVITADRTGKLELMNIVAEQLTGWTQEEAVGKSLSEVFHIINGKTGEVSRDPVALVLSEDRIIGLEKNTILISKNGEKYNIADSAAPIKDTGKKIRGVVLVFRNITEQLKIESELIRSRKLESVGVLAGGIAHDFNNILTGLFGNIELAKMNISKKHKAYPYIKTADKVLHRTIRLTKQLLTFARGGDPILDSVNIKRLVETSISRVLSGSNINVEIDLQENLREIQADEEQIGQVISNLLINAKEAMAGEGRICIKAENISNTTDNINGSLSGDFVRLYIRDEGSGISDEIIGKMFDPYFSTKETGNGLGLATSHSIISRHNGHISAESEPGAGALFTILLPVGKQPLKQSDQVSGGADKNTELPAVNILIMDDEEIVRNVAAAMLEKSGSTVEFASAGEEAVNKYISAGKAGRPFDVVFMDLVIPGGMGGKEAVKRILAVNPEANVIVSSGYSTDPVLANFREYGFKGRIIKPFKMANLNAEIIRVMNSE